MTEPHATDPIQRYLRELRCALAAPLPSCVPRDRRLLQEAEAHLRESAAREQQAGVDDSLAARRAIRRFGSPSEVAAAAKASRPRIPHGALAVLVGVLALGAGVASATAGASSRQQPVPPPRSASHHAAETCAPPPA